MITMPTPKANQTTAAAVYRERHTEAEDLVRRIAEQLRRHRNEQAGCPCDWGYAGDLGRVNEQLAYILAGLGDRTAVDAKGLEY